MLRDEEHGYKSSPSNRQPMAADIANNIDQDRMQLISPPPEETLHFRRSSRTTPLQSSKRKRLVPVENSELTPNPKPRKQHKQPEFIESPAKQKYHPHKPSTPLNPNADFLPPGSVSPRRARRISPIPAYDPPTDVFTPPRVVILSPNVSKSSKRKTATKPKSKPRNSEQQQLVKLSIKTEPPQIDLSAPMPPPSPTDDPLLLTSSPIRCRPTTPTQRRRELKEVGVSTSPPSHQSPIALEPVQFPHSSSPNDPVTSPQLDQFTQYDEQRLDTSSDFDMDVDAPHPLFDFSLPLADNDGWSSADDVDDDQQADNNFTRAGVVIGEGESEYTGRYHTLSVRTKTDPPSSATRDRQEEWGRPITPFPFRRVGRLELVKEALGVDTGEVQEQEEEEEEEKEVREMSLPLDNNHNEQAKEVSIPDEERVPQTPTPSTKTPLHPFDFDTSFELCVSEPALLNRDQADQDEQQPIEEHSSMESHEEEEEENEVREMSFVDEDEEVPVDSEYARDSQQSEVREHDQARDVDTTIQFALIAQDGIAGHDSNSNSIVNAIEHTTNDAPPADADVELDDDTSDESSDDTELEEGVVKITSADPMAAARAAAILKQYDYECYTRIALKAQNSAGKRRRHSLGSTRGVMDGGVVKTPSPVAAGKQRRKTLIGATGAVKVVGETVYIPGSPATTLPQLLKEAEEEVSASVPPSRAWKGREREKEVPEFTVKKNLFETPLQARKSLEERYHPPTTSSAGPSAHSEREWTKEEWKLLDACFTDERIALGGVEAEEGEALLAEVNRVRPEDVVKRFLEIVVGEQEEGLEELTRWGEDWSVENLIQRVKALQNKQRKGHVAPPTTPYTPSPRAAFVFSRAAANSNEMFTRRLPSMEVPEFTPLGRRAALPADARTGEQIRSLSVPTSKLPPPSDPGAPFAGLEEGYAEGTGMRRKIPGLLLAPRYSHLLEEAVRISQSTNVPRINPPAPAVTMVQDTEEVGVGGDGDEESQVEAEGDPHEKDGEDAEEPDVLDDSVMTEEESVSQEETTEPSSNDITNTIGTRVKGFLFSYLPTLSATQSKLPKPKAPSLRQPGLPLPPPDVLSKTKSRGPISTPVRPPSAKPKHPKELVSLVPAPVPKAKATTTGIPRRKPQRLVQLNHVSTPKEKEKVIVVPKPRRSSDASSVKDLVRGFEEMERNVNERKGDEEARLKRARSVSEWRKTAGPANGAAAASAKPSWRP